MRVSLFVFHFFLGILVQSLGTVHIFSCKYDVYIIYKLSSWFRSYYIFFSNLYLQFDTKYSILLFIIVLFFSEELITYHDNIMYDSSSINAWKYLICFLLNQQRKIPNVLRNELKIKIRCFMFKSRLFALGPAITLRLNCWPFDHMSGSIKPGLSFRNVRFRNDGRQYKGKRWRNSSSCVNFRSMLPKETMLLFGLVIIVTTVDAGKSELWQLFRLRFSFHSNCVCCFKSNLRPLAMSLLNQCFDQTITCM